jgi:hypothetical protein
MILSQNSAHAGTTLLETSIAACTAAMFLGSLFTMNITAMKTIRTAREASSASQVLQQRVEAMRIANWHQITDPDWVKNNLLNASAAGSENLKQISETLTLTPYDGATAGYTQIERSGGSLPVVRSTADLLKERALKVIWTVDYSGGMNAKTTTRQTVAVISKGGVAKW